MDMDSLLDRSAAFEHTVLRCFPATGVVLALSDDKHELVAAACEVCVEHGDVLRSAFALRAATSGSALLLLQYEALLRGVWLMFAATAAQVTKLATALGVESEQAAKNLPGYSEMLNVVLKSAPEGLAAPLAEFNQYSRHAVNSFVHSGLHALHRARHGCPEEMALTVVRFSNDLSHFACRMLASVSGSQRRMERVTGIYLEFTDCLPVK